MEALSKFEGANGGEIAKATRRNIVEPREAITNEAAAEALVSAVRAADSPEKCVDVLQRMDEEALRGRLEANLHRALTDSIRERRQQFMVKVKQEEKAKAGEPLQIEIRNIADWRRPGPCPYCQGSGAIS